MREKFRLPPIFPAGWGHPALRGNKICCAAGAGYAPPAVLRLQQHNGSFVGAAYMPPVAAIPVIQPNGQTARDAYMRPLQTYRKYRTITGLCNSNHYSVGAGQAPPAVLRLQQHNGSFVGAAYMPTVAACRTFPPHPARSAPPSPTGGRLAATKKRAAPSGRHAVILSCFSAAPLPRPSARANRRGSARHPGRRRRCSRGAGR